MLKSRLELTSIALGTPGESGFYNERHESHKEL